QESGASPPCDRPARDALLGQDRQPQTSRSASGYRLLSSAHPGVVRGVGRPAGSAYATADRVSADHAAALLSDMAGPDPLPVSHRAHLDSIRILRPDILALQALSIKV